MRRIICRLMAVCMAVAVLATVLHAEEGAAHGKKERERLIP